MKINKRKQKDYTGNPNKYPQKYFKDKSCRWCKKDFNPIAPSHLYCSDDCKDLAYSNNYYKRYNTEVLTVLETLEKQEKKCAICGGEGFKMHEGIKENLVVDHCHDSGMFRGLLCNNCNRGLGLFKDSIENLRNAIDYLEKFK